MRDSFNASGAESSTRRWRIQGAALLFAASAVVACSAGSSSGGTGGPGGVTGACACSAGDNNCCSVVLSPSAATTTVSIPIVAPGNGFQDYTAITIDATAFTSGGTIVVSGRVGSGSSPASVDLFPASATLPTEGSPSGQIADCYNNAAGSSFSVGYAFAAPASFKLGATGNWDVPAGTTNTVDLTISVTSDDPPSKSCGQGGGGGSSGGCSGCTHDSDCGSCQRCDRSSCTCVSRLTC